MVPFRHFRIITKREAPLEWTFSMARRAIFYIQAALGCFVGVQGIVSFFIGFTATALVHMFVSVMLILFAMCLRSTRFCWRSLHMGMMVVFTVEITLLLVSHALLPGHGAVYLHRSMGMVAIAWRSMLPFWNLRLRPCLLCLLWLTATEGISTYCVLHRIGLENETPRILFSLVVLSCTCFAWCYFQVGSWHELWSTQMQLAVEQESSKSLLSKVCDATFLLSRDGDTILRSTRQFDAIVGRPVEQSRLSSHLAESEVSRVRNAVLGHGLQSVTLLPTSIYRSKHFATNVELFIVSCRPESIPQAQSLNSVGFMIGLRLSQSFVDASESDCSHNTITEASELTDVCDTTSSQSYLGRDRFTSGGIRRRVTFSEDAESETSRPGRPALRRRMPVAEQARSQSEHSTASSSTFPGRRGPCLVAKHTQISFHGLAYSAPFKESGTYLKECCSSLLEDLVSSLNFEFESCCAWHGNLRKISSILEEMHSWHKCDDGWPAQISSWQCGNCLAVIPNSQADDYCWLCNAGRSSGEE